MKSQFIRQGSSWVRHLVQDFRYGHRLLLKNRVHTFISVLTLALGIGTSTTIFSVVYGVLLHSLPYYKSGQIVQIWQINSEGSHMRFDDPDFEDMHTQVRSLQSMAEIRSDETPVSVGNEPDRVRVASVSKDFFSVMGVHLVIGRPFGPEEQHLGAAPTALVSYTYWQRHLHQAADLGAVRFTISKKAIAIIGVLPPGFSFPDDSEIWMARETEARLPSRSAHNWQVVARIRDGVSLNQARTDMSAIAHQLYEQYGPHDMNMVDAAVFPLRDALTADIKPALLVLQGVAGLLLLVACANVMNLSLAQASARAGELAVRTALGASRWRVVRQFLTEAILLCLLGSFFGIIAANIGVHALLMLAPANIPRLNEISVNLPVLWFALGLSLVVAAGLGVLTALRATSGDVQKTLSETGRYQGQAASSQRLGRVLIAGQIAITLILLIGAGLLGRSMLRVLSIYPGFQTEHVLTLDLKLPDVTADTKNQRVQFLEQLISGLKGIPGVKDVGGTNALPLQSDPADGTFVVIKEQQLSFEQKELINRAAQASTKLEPALIKSINDFFGALFRDTSRVGSADYVVASEGYFPSLGISLLRGRLFNDGDTVEATHVAIISESVARQKFQGQEPLGQTIEFGNMDGDLRLLTVVGVVGEVRVQRLELVPHPTIYVNYRQRPVATSQFNVVLRTNSNPTTIFASARSVLSKLDPTIPLRFESFTRILSASLNDRRFNLLLVGVFALTALLLAMAGIFGVLAFSVAQRTREIGVRIALGATTGSVIKMVLGQGLSTVMIGTVIGIMGSFIFTRTIRSLLFGVSPIDPFTIAGVALVLIFLAMLASYIPARRATRVDPMVALRYE
jgi:putative ABC transport system permease protein